MTVCLLPMNADIVFTLARYDAANADKDVVAVPSHPTDGCF